MTCGRCGTALPESAAFCPSCGAPAGQSSEPSMPPPPEFAERTLEPESRPEPPTAPAWNPPPSPPAWSPPPAPEPLTAPAWSAPPAPEPPPAPVAVAPAAPAWAPPAAPAWTPPGPPAAQWGGVAAASAPAVAYSGFWRRFAAWFLDAILLYLAGALVSFALGVNPWMAEDFSLAYVASLFASVFIGWLYAALLESSPSQATVGQMALSIQVTDLQGRRIGFGRASGRHFAQYLSFFTFGIGYLMIAFTEKRQALHDMIAGCVLIKRKS